jgi:hypothetical protein
MYRLLARGPPPRGEEEEDNYSTPVAFDVDDGNGGEVEVNGECGGDGNSDGPIDNNDNDDYDVDDKTTTTMGGWEDRSANVGRDGGRGGEGGGG